MPGRRRPTRSPGRPPIGRPARGAWWAVLGGAALIVGIAWLISQLQQPSSQLLAAAAIAFALVEGVVLALVAASWSNRGMSLAIAASVLTAVLATAGRWELTYLRTSRTAEVPDLVLDFGFTVAWAVFAAVVGALVRRDRASASARHG